jgi:glycosyltransferase involved in cell wall biosynthesis
MYSRPREINMNSARKPKGVEKVLALVPNIFGYSGDAVNERQLLKSLCKGRRCLVISLLGITKLPRLRKCLNELYEEGWPKDALLIPLPTIFLYDFFTLIILMTSILVTPILWVLDRLIRFDLIYIRYSPLALGPLSVKSLSRKACVKLPAIAEDEVTKGKRIASLVHTLTDRFALAKARAVCVPTPILLKKIVTRRGLLPRRIVVTPPGVSEQKIRAVKGTLIYGSKGGYTIGFVGLLVWWQGADVLVKAVAKLKDMLDKPVTLLIVGDGFERRRIEKLCRELRVNCRITGFVKHEEALRHLMRFDVLVVPSVRISTTEANVPIKVIEAWALGVPVITTKHEVYEYIGLKDGEDIVYCDPDPNDLANKILAVLKNEELRKRLSERGSLLARNFYYDDIVFRLLETFTGVYD